MQYVFNPKNRQIVPMVDQMAVFPGLRDKKVSAELYALVCQGKVSIADVASMFAVNRSPECLVTNHKAVKQSPQVSEPEITKEIPPNPVLTPSTPEGTGESAPVSATGAFDGRELTKKTNEELYIIAASLEIDIKAPDFQPTRGNILKAICAKAKAAEAKAAEAPAA